jgi:hypothetical protein
VDRRLEDVHRQWHAAENAYFDPEGFRVAIQTAIQTLRTVTFILQSNKGLISSFDSWYQEWRDRLGSDQLMRWMVDARNRIEKQGDLEAHSFVRAEIVASYLNEGPIIEVPANLFDTPAALLRNIPQSALGEHIRKTGTLRVQRRWIENTLPGRELLDAVAVAYGRIAELVGDAHREIGLELPITKDIDSGEIYPVGRGGRLPCMIGHSDVRTLNISISNGARIELSTESITIDREAAEKAAERYALNPKDVFDLSGDTEKVLESLFSTARKMTEADGHHVTVLFLMREGKPVRIAAITFENQGEKYLVMRNPAHEAAKLEADAAIMIGEGWRARADPNQPYMHAADATDREEYLVATLVRKIGSPVHLMAKFARHGKRVSLDETTIERDGAHFMFGPFYEAWGRPIPGSWIELVKNTLHPSA